MQIDGLPVIESYVNEEDSPPPGLREFIIQSYEAARLANQYAAGWMGHGGWQLRERVMRVADLCAPFGGDIAQIGHGGGYVTSGLAAVARKNDCRIVAVDTGASDEERELLAQATLPWRDETLQASSERILRILSDRDALGDFNFCFALVSGKDNSFLAYFNDIMRFTSCPVVAVDPCFCPDGPRLAFEATAAFQERTMVRSVWCREGYLVMKP